MTDTFTGGGKSNNFSDEQLAEAAEMIKDMLASGRVLYNTASASALSTALSQMIAAGSTMPAPLVQELTASGAVTAGVESLELNHATVTIAATIADAVNHQGIFIAKATTEPGVGGDHTVTLTSGTWNGTATIATFADVNDALAVYFDSAGNGTVISNIGSVALS